MNRLYVNKIRQKFLLNQRMDNVIQIFTMNVQLQ